MRTILACNTSSKTSYNFDIFKIDNDDPSFEKFEEFYNEDSDEEISDILPEGYEWIRKHGNKFLLPLESGVLVITLDHSQLAHLISHRMLIYVSYSISNEMDTFRLSINIADIILTSKCLYDNDLSIMEWKEQIFINLLTLKSTSECGSFIIHISNDSEQINEFLSELNMELIQQSSRRNINNYEYLSTQHNSNMRYHFFFGCCSAGYFNGAFIRFSYVKRNVIKAKIYARSPHQLLNFIQAFYQNFKCTIKFC